MHGEFLVVEPHSRLVFSWGWASELLGVPPSSTLVEVTLTPAPEGTKLRLTHRRLPPASVEFHTTGWAHYLGRLALRVEGKDPGPDTMRRRAPRG